MDAELQNKTKKENRRKTKRRKRRKRSLNSVEVFWSSQKAGTRRRSFLLFSSRQQDEIMQTYTEMCTRMYRKYIHRNI